jgi:hypothetical protein
MTSPLRYRILDMALKVEHELSKIISSIIKVDPKGSKTLSNKSSAIPFKVKVDLLFDLQRLSKDEYNVLILFMEIRNQLVHNYEVDTLEKALGAIEKKPKFLSLNPIVAKLYETSTTVDEKEHCLLMILDYLGLAIDNIMISLLKLLVKDLEAEQQNQRNKSLLETYEEFMKIMNETQEAVALNISNALSEDEVIRNDFKRLIETVFYVEFRKRVELKYGKIEDVVLPTSKESNQ